MAQNMGIVKIKDGKFYDANDDLILTDQEMTISVDEIIRHYKKIEKIRELREVLETHLNEVADLLDNNVDVKIEIGDLLRVDDTSISAAFDPFPKDRDLGKRIDIKIDEKILFQILKYPKENM